MSKVVRLTESDLVRLVKKIIKEQSTESDVNFTVKKAPNKKFFIWATTQNEPNPNFVTSIFPSLKYIDVLANGFSTQQEALNYIENLKKIQLVSKKQVDMKNVQLFSDQQETQKVFTPTLSLEDRYKDELIFLGYLEHGERVKLNYTCGNDFLEDKIKKVKYYNKKFTDLLNLYTMCETLKTPPKTPDFQP
jgi:hypothetical protein